MNGPPPNWKGIKKVLILNTPLPLLVLLMGQMRGEIFTLFDIVLFQYVWRERNNAIHAGTKKPPTEFIEFIFSRYLECK